MNFLATDVSPRKSLRAPGCAISVLHREKFLTTKSFINFVVGGVVSLARYQ